MLTTIEAITDQDGTLRILGPMKLPKGRRVIITILNEEPSDEITNLALLSEPALAREWEHPEEDEAWSHLAQLPWLWQRPYSSPPNPQPLKLPLS